MEMIEKLARAICESRWADRDDVLNDEMGDDMKDIYWIDYVPDAKLALQSIREPSEGMLFKGCAETPYRWESESGAKMTGDVWRAMIDAALAETGRTVSLGYRARPHEESE